MADALFIDPRLASPEIIFESGDAYFLGTNVTRDVKKALELWRLSAEKGYPLAQARLSLVYLKGLEGDFVGTDLNESLKWLKKAAEAGLASAQFYLGEAYRYGEPYGEKDIFLSFEWYAKAAAQGFDQAQYKLGVFYALGDGIKQDRAKGGGILAFGRRSKSCRGP
jgi:TPR repeat protein